MLLRDGASSAMTTTVRETPPAYESAPSSRDTTLVGRADDLALLTAALHQAQTGNGGGCYLYGAPGIGKSRLVRELIRIAKPDGFAIRTTTCQPQDVHRPLSVFVDMIPTLRELPGASGCFPHTHAYLDRLTRHGTTVSVPDAEAREGEQLYEHIRRALFDLVEAVTEEQPVLFIVENVQWSDPQSWALLRDLNARATSQAILFVFTSREPWQIATDGPLPSYLTSQRIDAIAPDAARQHAEEYAAVLHHPPDEAMLAWCVQTAEGNPYFIEELLNHWAATGKPFSAPETLIALINTRIRGLSDTSLRLLQASAVLNKNSTLVRLRAMLEYPEYQFLTALEELIQAGMLTTELRTRTGVHNQVLCRHDILTDQALQQLSPAGRQWLHHRTGIILDAELGSQSTTIALVWDCAQHWHAAGNTARAVQLGLVCATHLIEVGLSGDAVTVCRNTLEFCTTSPERLDTTVCYIRALFFANEFSEIPKRLQEIHSLRLSLGQDASPHDDIEILGLETGWAICHNVENLLAQATHCVETPSATLSHRLEAGLMLLKVGHNVGNIAAMHQVYQTLAPELARADFRESDTSLTFEVVYHAACGDLDKCGVASNRLIEFSRSKLTGSRLRRALMNGARGLGFAGYREVADIIYEEVFEIAIRERSYYQATQAVQELIWSQITYGDCGAAREWIVRAEELNRPTEERWGKIVMALTAATVAFYDEDIAEIERLVIPYLADLIQDPVTSTRIDALAFAIRLGIADRLPPTFASISELVDRAYADYLILRRHGHRDLIAFSLYLGLTHLHRETEALDLLTEYVHISRRDRGPLPQKIALLLQHHGQLYPSSGPTQLPIDTNGLAVPTQRQE